MSNYHSGFSNINYVYDNFMAQTGGRVSPRSTSNSNSFVLPSGRRECISNGSSQANVIIFTSSAQPTVFQGVYQVNTNIPWR